MSATVQCSCCGRIAHARVVEDDPSTNAFECEPDWQDDDQDYGYIVINGKSYVYMDNDVECRLFEQLCQHEDYEILEVNYDDY